MIARDKKGFAEVLNMLRDWMRKVDLQGNWMKTWKIMNDRLSMSGLMISLLKKGEFRI